MATRPNHGTPYIFPARRHAPQRLLTGGPIFATDSGNAQPGDTTFTSARRENQTIQAARTSVYLMPHHDSCILPGSAPDLDRTVLLAEP